MSVVGKHRRLRPVVWAMMLGTTLPLVVGTVTLIRHPGGSELGRTFDQFLSVLRDGGVLAVLLILSNYIGSVGLLIVMSVLAARWWSTWRVLAFVIVSVTCLLAFSHNRAFQPPYIFALQFQGASPSGSLPPHWTSFLTGYHPVLLLMSIALGYLVSIPLRHGKRYWLSRGCCPRCHYDLQANVKDGCPECGWKRAKTLNVKEA